MQMFRNTLALLLLFLISAISAQESSESPADYIADVRYTLTTGLADGRMAFIGVGGDIDGVTNPLLTAQPGQVVQITLVNGDNVAHDIKVDDFRGAESDIVDREGASTSVVFRAPEAGDYDYWCTIPGHRAAGMEGQFRVGTPAEVAVEELETIVREPTDLPGPLGGSREPVNHEITLTTIEREAPLADGTTYRYWTFDNKVPGPFLRIKEGDTVDVVLENRADSHFIHSVDMHSVTGPGGGAVATQTLPGDRTGFSFTALKPGLYVYHCATPMVAHHITNGMYGLILVEPKEGLPEVDREFYVMQGEVYTDKPFGSRGNQEFSVDKLLDEKPEYYVFNGAVGAISEQFPLEAQVGETIRIFFGVGGPNKISSFHIIGEIFDRVYHEGTLSDPPKTDVQTTLVPAGGATIVELTLMVPGEYILVDHALSRAERGLAGKLIVRGEENPEVYTPGISGSAE